MKKYNKFKIGDKVVRKSNPEQVLEVMNIHILGGGQSFRYDLRQKGSTCDVTGSTVNFYNVREGKIEAYVEKPKFKVGDYVRIKRIGRVMQINAIVFLVKNTYRLSDSPIIFTEEDIIPYEPYAADFYVCASKNGRKSIAVYPNIDTEHITAYEYACDYTTHVLVDNIFLNLGEYPDIVLLRPATPEEKAKLIKAVEEKYHKTYDEETKSWVDIKPIPKVEKPPLGLMPLSEHNRLRQEEIMSAIERYTDAGLEIPIEWLEEIRELVIYDVETAFGVSNNDNVAQFRILANELSDLYKQKNEAYGDSFGKSVEKYGKVSALTRMSDKWNRLENLMMNEDIDSGDESVIDTLKDLASYCLMTIIELKR